MASKSSRVISCHQHRVLLLAREIPFSLTHSNPFICCMILCDRNGIMPSSSVSRRLHNQRVQWNYSVGERRLMIQKINSRTPMTDYQIMWFGNNYCTTVTTVKGSSFWPERLMNIYITLPTLPSILVSTIGNQ